MLLSPVSIGTRLEMWHWTPDSGVGGRFALVHGLDRMNNDDGTRRLFFRRVADLVKAAEANTHRRSIVVGDFNAQPFESAVLSSDGLHAIGIRQESNQTSRPIRLTDDREEFFYNPMWRLYGHVPSQEAGMATHYWQNRLAGELFWHMLDQVVLRPEECVRFPEDRIKILTTVGAVHLLAPDGTPDKTVGSDHLPLVFQWNV
jgi:Endonuclease/Exonuclease/phosphatase family